MKKILIVLALLFSLNVSHASFVLSKEKVSTTQSGENTDLSSKNPIAKESLDEAPNVPTKAQQQKALMEKVVKMSVKDYEDLTGKKMNFVDRLTFKILKARFAKKLGMGGDYDSEGFNFGGFILGFLLGLLGVLGAYIFSKDRNFRKWTWIGWGVFVAIYLVIVLAV